MTRSLSVQTVDELGGPGSVLARQQRDHVRLDRLIHRLEGSTGSEQEEVLQRIDRLVFSHAFAEETVLWPVIRRVLPDGEELTLRIEEDHQEVDEIVAELERGGVGHPHPTVSRRPPGNALSGLPLSLLDRTRDAVDAGVRRVPALAPAGRAVSGGLAALAGLVERVPVSRSGDGGTPTSR